jgi:hypothetical protein
VAGVAETDEPLPIDGLGHLLQRLDPPPGVLDQVVEGSENFGSQYLLASRQHGDGKAGDDRRVQVGHRRADRLSLKEIDRSA